MLIRAVVAAIVGLLVFGLTIYCAVARSCGTAQCSHCGSDMCLGAFL